MSDKHPAHEAGRRSREAVIARDKDAWLAVFDDDGIVEDPIGPSHFDPEGKGHRGRAAISAFWDKAIAPTDKIEFVFRDTYQCGNEEANVGDVYKRQSQISPASATFFGPSAPSRIGMSARSG